jgi:hypothetical protein
LEKKGSKNVFMKNTCAEKKYERTLLAGYL